MDELPMIEGIIVLVGQRIAVRSPKSLIRRSPLMIFLTIRRWMAAILIAMLCAAPAAAQTWNGYAGDAQHTALSATASQPLDAIRWQTAVDLDPQLSGDNLLIHYGSPIITAAN